MQLPATFPGVLEIERVFEASRIRRGRQATGPVFSVRARDGARWRFHRRFDARAFIATGGECASHETIFCRNCNGMRYAPEGAYAHMGKVVRSGGTGARYVVAFYDPHAGLWLVNVEDDADRRCISERAMGATFHEVRCVNCGQNVSTHREGRLPEDCHGFVELGGHVSATAGALIAATDCTCHHTCGKDSHSGDWHQHEADPCPVHPDAVMVG